MYRERKVRLQTRPVPLTLTLFRYQSEQPCKLTCCPTKVRDISKDGNPVDVSPNLSSRWFRRPLHFTVQI